VEKYLDRFQILTLSHIRWLCPRIWLDALGEAGSYLSSAFWILLVKTRIKIPERNSDRYVNVALIFQSACARGERTWSL